MSLGRNDPCRCGSGRKYKKCCLDSDRAPTLVSERDSEGRLIGKAPIDTMWEAKGQRVRAVGGTFAFRPPNETDHEFYLSHLRVTLGEDWHRAQLKRPEAKRHVIEGWFDAWRREATSDPAKKVEIPRVAGPLFATVATGQLKALLCLAYDVYTLDHAMVLPHALVNRLRIPDQFQGARYEIAVASVFVRAGYEVEWLTATDRKLPEFVARHPSSRVEIAVEAKSRHRLGVLGREGDLPDLDELKIDVGGLMKRALAKEVDGRPLVVCLDLNLPLQRGGDAERWAEELHQNVLRPYDSENPIPFAAVFVTNYSWHWEGAEPAGNPMNFVVRALDAAAPLQANEAELLSEALFQYGDVPEATAAAA